MRNLLFIAALALFAGSCTSARHSTVSVKESGGNATSNNPVFLNNIVFHHGSSASKKKAEAEIPSVPENDEVSHSYMFPAYTIEQTEALQFKYAILMNTEVEKLKNKELYKFIESWWGTPYRMGGSTSKGIDCSAFTQTLLSAIYGVDIPRTAIEQKKACTTIGENELREGDLVFFNTRGKGVTHVGVYLQDYKFVHAASSQGVMISSLYEPYWFKRLISAGRIVDDLTAAAVSLTNR
ncbi:MAG: C40 family peptidase [Chitinophagaceae bacterium]|nr:C40 family peptidase [Chitinophagaceae bacterium]